MLISSPYSIKKLETFMCNGVAARFGDEEGLFRILNQLISPPYSIKKLESFMCNGVAARFGDEEFMAAIATMPNKTQCHVQVLCRSYPLTKRRRM